MEYNRDFVHYQVPATRKETPKAQESTKSLSPDANSIAEPSLADETSSKAASAPTAITVARPTEHHEEAETATRPRLTREQAELLERHFQQYYKPTGNMKRELAAATGLSLQRIANWFQNRRAKSKQQKKQEEFELQQALASANSASMMMHRPDYFHMAEHYAPDMEFNYIPAYVEQPQLEQIPHAMYTPVHGVHPADANFITLQRSIEAANRPAPQTVYEQMHANHNFSALDLQIPTSTAIQPAFSADGSISALPASSYSDWSSRNSSAIWTPARQPSDPFEAQYHMPREPVIRENVDPNQNDMEELCGVNPFQQFHQGIQTTQQKNPFQIQPFPTQLVQRSQHHIVPMAAPQHSVELLAHQSHESMISPEQTHSPEMAAPSDSGSQGTPPTSAEEVFKLPEAPLNIAARRKRPRPAAIGGAALRSQSFMGSLPRSPKAQQLLGGTSPMRRIKSTGNNLDMVRGRIQKNISVSGQKSPLNFETFADAGAFDAIGPDGPSRAVAESSPAPSSIPPAATTINAGSNTSSSNTTNLTPPTPLSPRFNMDSHSSSNDSELSWAFDSSAQPCFAPTLGDLRTEVASPPMTPLHPDLLQSLYMINYSPAVSNGTPQWSLSSPDEPLTSPLFGHFQAGMHQPMIQSDSDASTALSQMQFVPENKLPGQESHASISLSTAEPTAMVCSAPEPAASATEFFFHEPLPEQQPQPPQEMMQPKPRHYTFANQGPEDF